MINEGVIRRAYTLKLIPGEMGNDKLRLTICANLCKFYTSSFLIPTFCKRVSKSRTRTGASVINSIHKIPVNITMPRAPIPFDDVRSSGADVFLRIVEDSSLLSTASSCLSCFTASVNWAEVMFFRAGSPTL